MDRRIIHFVVLTVALIFLLTTIKNFLFPPPPAPLAAATASGVAASHPAPSAPAAAAADPAAPALQPAARPPAKPNADAVLLAVIRGLGQDPVGLLHLMPDAEADAVFIQLARRAAFLAGLNQRPEKLHVISNDNIEAVFSERGAALKSVTLKRYRTATRDYARPDPQQRPLVLFTDDEHGKLLALDPLKQLERQSFRFMIPEHYLVWTLQPKKPEDQTLVFVAELAAKNLRVTKTFSLNPATYHVEMALDFTALDPRKPAEFVYEVDGPHGVNVEGIHWKQTTFWQAPTCVIDVYDPRRATRFLDDATKLDPKRAGTNLVVKHVLNDPNNDVIFQFTGVVNQFFAALIVAQRDAEQLPPRLAAEVRPYYAGDTPEVPKYQMPFQGAIGVKLVSLPVKLAGQAVRHRYFLYTGPSKTMLLDFEKNVAPGLVQFYNQQHRLNLLTDAPFDNALSRAFNKIGWTSLIVFFTDLMHWLLEQLHFVFRSYGVAILVMTILVRAMLYPISRRQAQNAKDMQEKMARLKPELKKLDEKYKNDPQGKMAAQMELYRKHGFNPLSSCTGCLIMLMQLPVFMGLYYALNESTHLRLSGFLWFPNLAAPDMLLYWGEWPVFSALARGVNVLVGTITFGDFLNLLPIIAAALMFFQQKMMSPPAMDEQQAMQMKMMSWMLLLMGYLFYWVASGLCMYFIVSSAWGMLERKLLPKKKDDASAAKVAAKPGDKPKAGGNGQPGLSERAKEMWKRLLREAAKK
jgi:YidC/Oxa1 family membrane protein insertase